MHLLHRINRSQIFCQMRIFRLDQPHHHRTVRRDHQFFLLLFPQKPGIFFLHHSCALRRVKCFPETHFLQIFFQITNTVPAISCKISRMYRRDHLFAGRDHSLDSRDIVVFYLCVLRTDSDTFLAENTLFFNDLCLLVCDPDRLYGTVADTFIAVFTIGCTKLQDRCVAHSVPPLS